MTAIISINYIHVKKHLLKDKKLVASIDKGGSLTKLLYLSKSDAEDCVDKDEYRLTMELYDNVDFTIVIDSLVANVNMPENPSREILYVTGIGCELEKKLLKEKIPFQLTFVEEYFTQVKGLYFLVNNPNEEECCYPTDDVVVEELQFESEGFMDKITADLKSKNEEVHENKGPFPCVVGIFGTGSMFYKMEDDGSHILIDDYYFNGRCFLGLCKLLLRTDNYDEVDQLANKGNRGNVDLVVSKIFSNSPTSAYGKYHPDLPLLSFGKAADLDKNLNEFKREDIAASLLYAFGANIISIAVSHATATKTTRIYLGGNLYRSSFVRKSMIHNLKLFHLDKLFTVKFLKTGHSGALGALFAEEGKQNSLIS